MQPLALLLAAAPAASALRYALPAELAALAELFSFGAPAASSSASTATAASTASSDSSSSSAAASTCYYPDNYTLTDVATWTPASTAANSSNATYISFTFADAGTAITTACRFNASSVSLTEGTSLAARYACDNSIVSFIWQKGEVTMIEVTCPGKTTTVYEASGSVPISGLACEHKDAASSPEHADGTLCTSSDDFAADFTSQEPSPLSSSAKKTRRMDRVRRSFTPVFAEVQ